MANKISVEVIASKIYEIRGKKVMLDRDLAKLYAVQTKHLTRQVRRNIKRFPADFLIRLTQKEYRDFLWCQIGTIKRGGYFRVKLDIAFCDFKLFDMPFWHIMCSLS